METKKMSCKGIDSDSKGSDGIDSIVSGIKEGIRSIGSEVRSVLAWLGLENADADDDDDDDDDYDDEEEEEEEKEEEEDEERFGKHFTEAQVEGWADKLRAENTPRTQEKIAAMKKLIAEKRVYCRVTESMLESCFRWQGEDPTAPSFDPSKSALICQSRILLVSECLRRPGRAPGTNPDEIKV